MARLKLAKSENEIKTMTLGALKKEYNALADDYNKIVNQDLVYCSECDSFISRSNFYTSDTTKNGLVNIGCKKCIAKMATDYDKKSNSYVDNREKTIETLRRMNLPYIDSLYKSSITSVSSEVNEKNRTTAWFQYITSLKSLMQYKGKTWRDSEFPIEEDDENAKEKKIKASTIKRFGQGLSNEEYAFLQDQYEDWVSRYECNTKAQEELFERLSFKKLELFKATREGKPTKDLDESYQKLMSTANITPRQNSLDALSEGQNLGQLIEKWENEQPIPEPDPDFADVDNIGKYIDVFLRGHMAKTVGIKNRFTALYENWMKQYTVSKPEYDEDEDSEELFEKIFGSGGE